MSNEITKIAEKSAKLAKGYKILSELIDNAGLTKEDLECIYIALDIKSYFLEKQVK